MSMSEFSFQMHRFDLSDTLKPGFLCLQSSVEPAPLTGENILAYYEKLIDQMPVNIRKAIHMEKREVFSDSSDITSARVYDFLDNTLFLSIAEEAEKLDTNDLELMRDLLNPQITSMLYRERELTLHSTANLNELCNFLLLSNSRLKERESTLKHPKEGEPPIVVLPGCGAISRAEVEIISRHFAYYTRDGRLLDAKIIGIDSSSKSIEFCRRECTGSEHEFICSDISDCLSLYQKAHVAVLIHPDLTAETRYFEGKAELLSAMTSTPPELDKNWEKCISMLLQNNLPVLVSTYFGIEMSSLLSNRKIRSLVVSQPPDDTLPDYTKLCREMVIDHHLPCADKGFRSAQIDSGISSLNEREELKNEIRRLWRTLFLTGVFRHRFVLI